MNYTKLIAQKEMKSYFSTPTAYIVLVFLILVPGQHLYNHEPSRVIFIGTAIILCGAGVLFRFIRTYTILSEEA